MLKRLADNVKVYKEIWGFLALVVGLGVSWGTMSTKLSTVTARLADTAGDLKETNRALRETEQRLNRAIERRFDRAHDLLERRLQQNETALGELHGSVERLAFITGTVNGGTHFPSAPAAKQARIDIQESLQRAERHPYLKQWGGDPIAIDGDGIVESHAPPTLPAF